jgi:hypothetical protein
MKFAQFGKIEDAGDVDGWSITATVGVLPPTTMSSRVFVEELFEVHVGHGESWLVNTAVHQSYRLKISKGERRYQVVMSSNPSATGRRTTRVRGRPWWRMK